MTISYKKTKEVIMEFVTLYLWQHIDSFWLVIILMVLILGKVIYGLIDDWAKKDIRKNAVAGFNKKDIKKLKGKFISWKASTEIEVADRDPRYSGKAIYTNYHKESAADYEGHIKTLKYRLISTESLEQYIDEGPYAVSFEGIFESDAQKHHIVISREDFDTIYASDKVAICLEGAVKYKAKTINVEVWCVDNKYIVYSFLNKKTLAFYSPEAAAAYSDLEPWFDGLDAYGNVVADFDENKAIAEYGEYWNIGADEKGEPGKVADDALPFDLEEIAKRKKGEPL